MKINLIANNTQEKRILTYLEENANETLIDKINNGTSIEKDGNILTNKKTLESFMKYACKEAQKLAENGARSICINDDTVYGWAIHYFEEESIEGTLYTETGEEYKHIQKPETTAETKITSKPKSQTVKEKSGQLSFFDLLENTSETTESVEDIEIEPEINDTHNENIEIEEKQPQCKAFYQEYTEAEKQYPNHTIVQRLGDFYEVFGEKAIQIANLVELTLTSKDCGTNERQPMIGFPYHAADNYFEKILRFMPIAIIENEKITIRNKINDSETTITTQNSSIETNKPKTLMEHYEEMCKAYPDFIVAIQHKNLYRIYGKNAKILSNEFYFTLLKENGYEYISFPKRQHFISIITQTHNLAIGSCLEDIEFYIENNKEGRIQCL